MRLSLLLVAGGFVICVLAAYPLAIVDWLPRSIQLLIGAIALIAGVCLIEVEDFIRPKLVRREPPGPLDLFEASNALRRRATQRPTRPSPTQASVRDPRDPT